MSRKIFLFFFLVSSVFCAQAMEQLSMISSNLQLSGLAGATLITKRVSPKCESYTVQVGPFKTYFASYFFDSCSYFAHEIYRRGEMETDTEMNCSMAFFKSCKKLYNSGKTPTRLVE